MVNQYKNSFLSGGGEMGELIRRYDWKNTTLGDPITWPQSLKTAVRLLLSSGHPMFIWWGPELIQFYNDAYRRSIGLARRFSALGQGGSECWNEIWHIIGPQIEKVMSGDGSTWHENQLVPIVRQSGKRENVYWTYSYSPIDEPGAPTGVGGVFVICTEATSQVLAEQGKKAVELRWREMFNQAPGFMCILRGPQHIYEFANPGYLNLVGGRDLIGKSVKEAVPEVESQGFLELLDDVYRMGKPIQGVATPLSIAQLGGNIHYIYIDFVYQPMVNSRGEVTGIFVSGYDVTDRVHAREFLLQADQGKDKFLAMLC
jgi:PAS domain-containing protein